jgi:hypothetical protein
VAWVWTRVGVVGVTAGVLLFSMAWFVYMASPRRLQNRLLSAILAMVGIAAATSFGLAYLTDDPNRALAWAHVGVVFNVSYYLLYPAFLSTLPTPLARPLVPLRPFLYALSAIVPWFTVTDTRWLFGGITPVAYAPYEAVPGPAFGFLAVYSLFLGFLGLVLAISSCRRAPRGSLLRDRARAYLAAFVVVDGMLIAIAVFLIVVQLVGGIGALLRFGEFINLSQTLAIVAFAFLLAYGMLTTQLFDLQLRLKKGAGRTAVIALIAVTFFVVSQTAEALLPVDGFLPGLVGAGILALAFMPLQRAAIRILDRMFPAIRETPAYVRRRKEAIYAAAFEELARDGRISEEDRIQLENLKARLGLA